MKKIFIVILSAVSMSLFAEEVLTIGYVPEMKPITFTNEEGQPDGFAIELWTKIYRELGYETRFITAPFEELYTQILNHELDAFATLIRNPEREEHIFYPDEPISTGWGQLFTVKGRYIANIEDLQDKKIGLMKTDAKAQRFEELMQAIQISFEPIFFETNNDIVTALKNDVIFAGISNNIFVSNNYEIAPTPIIFSPMSAYTATAKTNDEIIGLMKQADNRLKALRADESSYYWDLYRKWMSTTVIVENKTPLWIVIVIACLIFIALFSLFISRFLKHQVELRTAELSSAVREKDILIHEIQHRVKNNMAIISSFLSLQEMYLEARDEKEILLSSRKRIDSMALVHEMLYNHPDLNAVSFQEYTENIFNKLISEYNPLSIKPALNIEIEDVYIKMDYMIPMGIIITEIISNSLQHAFPETENPQIIISGKINNSGKYELALSDNGIGIPNQFIEKIESVGLSLIRGLTEQLNGDFTISGEDGTLVTLSIALS